MSGRSNSSTSRAVTPSTGSGIRPPDRPRRSQNRCIRTGVGSLALPGPSSSPASRGRQSFAPIDSTHTGFSQGDPALFPFRLQATGATRGGGLYSPSRGRQAVGIALRRRQAMPRPTRAADPPRNSVDGSGTAVTPGPSMSSETIVSESNGRPCQLTQMLLASKVVREVSNPVMFVAGVACSPFLGPVIKQITDAVVQ